MAQAGKATPEYSEPLLVDAYGEHAHLETHHLEIKDLPKVVRVLL